MLPPSSNPRLVFVSVTGISPMAGMWRVAAGHESVSKSK